MNRASVLAPRVIFGVFELITGILLVKNPQGFAKTVVLVFGLVLLLAGAAMLVTAARQGRGRAWKAGGIVALVLGAVCLLLPRWITGLFSLGAVLYGVILLLSGLAKYQDCKVSRRGLFGKLSALGTALFGLWAIFHPFGTVAAALRILGIVLIIQAALDLAAAIWSGKNLA